MKLFTAIIMFCFSAISLAQDRPFKMRQIVRVECRSGTQLNPAESIIPGMMLPLQTPENEEEGRAITLEFEITKDGSETMSGKPACPLGDFLVIEFAGK